jgi:ATP-binding cassette subfamily A (ABC1) protein 3
MGCRTIPYWLGYYLYDLTICVLILIIFIIAVNAFGLSYINDASVYLLLFFCFVAYLPLAYLLSWMFTNFLTAVRSLILV